MMEAKCENCDSWQHNGGPLNVGYCRMNKMAYRKAKQTCDYFIRIISHGSSSTSSGFIGLRWEKASWYPVYSIKTQTKLMLCTDGLVTYPTSEDAVKAAVKEIMGAIGEFSVEDAKDIRMLCDTALTPTLF